MPLTQTVLSCYTVRDMLERRFLRKCYGYHCHFVFLISIKRIIINTKVIILVSRTVTDKRLFSAEIIIIWANNGIHSITGWFLASVLLELSKLYGEITFGSVGTSDFRFELVKRFSYIVHIPKESSNLSGRRPEFLYLVSDICVY